MDWKRGLVVFFAPRNGKLNHWPTRGNDMDDVDQAYNGVRLTGRCAGCDRSLYQAFARCPQCGTVRPEFEQYKSVIIAEQTGCVFSGAATDVMLPNGDGIWAEYFLGFLKFGWLDKQFRYTEAFYEKHPHMRPPI
jgi:hypothetical protein